MSGQHAIVHRLIPGGANVNLADEVTWDFLNADTVSPEEAVTVYQRARSK